MRSLISLCFLGTWALVAQSSPAPFVVINGQTVSENEAKAILPNEPLDTDAAKEKIILFKLAVQAARTQGLAELPTVKAEIEKALYREFLRQAVLSHQKSLELSQLEWKALYDKNPLIRLRHLYRSAKSEPEKQKARALLQKIKRDLKKGIPFKQMVLKHSQDDSQAWGGDLDFKGVNSLPKVFYEAALLLKAGEVSPILETEDGCHLVELIQLQDFKNASAVYLNFLRSQELTRKETALLKEMLQALKQEAKIEIPSERSSSR